MSLSCTKTAFIALTLIASGYLQAEVYKWTDEAGQVHYGDKSQGESSKEMKVDAKSGNNSTAGDAEKQAYQKRVLESFEHERERKQEQKAKEEAKRAEQEQNCQQAKNRLGNIENARYLYQKDENGEQKIFSDEQRKVATSQAQAAVKKYCR